MRHTIYEMIEKITNISSCRKFTELIFTDRKRNGCEILQAYGRCKGIRVQKVQFGRYE